jgi:regulator of protease activity HflC (stomatin/prohibitin superfamily)
MVAEMPGWIVFLVVALLVLAIVGWVVLVDAIVRIDAGQLGLVLYKGRATDRVLQPGAHFVPTFRRKMVELYPSLELAYRAGDTEAGDAPERAFEHGGPPLVVVLGDRSSVTLSYTVRFRLDLDNLRSVHERFGGQGIWAAIRDQSAASVRRRLCEDGVGVDDLYGPARAALEADLASRLESELADEGLELVLFTLGDTDLGRTGEVIQATTRARYELAREEAEADTRRARARNDAELGVVVGDASMDAALRYREVDAWREVAWTMVARNGTVPPPSVRATAPPPPESAPELPASEPVETTQP